LGRQLRRHFPFLDVLSGAKDIENFSDTLDNSGLFPPTTDGGEILKPGLTGYVTIMRGCNFACTYCIVPTVRGPIKCLAQEDILNSVRQKVAQGAKEIMLLGQTVNAYQNGNTTFADLLNRTTEIPGVERVRFTSPHPIYFTPAFWQAVKDNPKIARHLHLPAQSGSTKVLGEMKRGYTREILLEKIKELKSCGFHISTDLIVGFPTETEEDFQDTVSLVEKVGYDGAFTFVYSPREGTVASKMQEQVPADVKKDRIMRLVDLQNERNRVDSLKYVGKTVEILVEDFDKKKNAYMGRDERGRMAYFEFGQNLVGKFVDVTITSTGGMSLLGKVVKVID